MLLISPLRSVPCCPVIAGRRLRPRFRSVPRWPVLRIRQAFVDRLRGRCPPHYAWGLVSLRIDRAPPAWARKPRPKRR